MFFKDFVSVKRQKIKRGASQTYDTPSIFAAKINDYEILKFKLLKDFARKHPDAADPLMR